MARLLVAALLVLSFWSCQVEGVNLAYKKPTWQSSEKYPSDKAVDGLSNLTAVSNHCAISEASPTDVTWMVDLEAIHSIIYIIIHYRTENEPFANSVYASRFLGFSVYVSNTTNKDDGQLCYHESNQTNIFEIMKVTCEVQGRYVIYYNTREGNETKKPDYSAMAYVELCEVTVIGCPLGFYSMDCSKPCPHGCRHCSFLHGICLGGCNPGFEGLHCEIYKRINVALHRPTFQLYTALASYPSSKLVDGKKSALKIRNNQCTTTSHGQTFALWRVDLQSNRRIERITVYALTENKAWDVNNTYTARLLGFSIVVSNTIVTDIIDGVVCFHDEGYNRYTVPSVVDIFCSVIGRYVIYFNERFPGIGYAKDYSQYAYLDLCEIEVYGCPFPEFGYDDPGCTVPCYEMCRSYFQTLSYLKPTWQSLTASGMGSRKAVDGKRYEGFCTSTLAGHTVTWWVNLEKICRIYSIALYFRTGGHVWNYNNAYTTFYLGFSLYISNTTNRHDGVLCHKEATFTRHTVPSNMTIECESPGQYVIYYNERLQGTTYPDGYSTLVRGDLCEVEVLRCPTPVAELPQCSKPCPSNCDQCYPRTGVCKTCRRGYKGYACELICHAVVNITVNPKSPTNSSNYTAMFTPEGLTFPSSGVYDGPKYGPLQREFTLQNSLNTKVFAIRLTVVYMKPIRISNLKLPLRNCFSETTNA